MNKIISFVWNNFDNDDRVKKKSITLSTKNKVVVYCVPKPKDWAVPIKMVNENLIVRYIKTKNIVDWVWKRVFINEWFWRKNLNSSDLNVINGELFIDCNDPDTLSVGVHILKKYKKGYKLVYDAHEYFKDNFVFYTSPFLFFNSLICYTSYKIREKIYTPYVSEVTTVSDGIADLIKKDLEHLIMDKKVTTIPNYCYKNINKINFQKKAKIAVFVGGYVRQGLNDIIKKFIIENWRVQVIGNIPRKKIEKVEYVGYLKKEEYMKILEKAAIGLLYYDVPNKSYKHSCPNKMSDYIQAGCFVLANKDLKNVCNIIQKYSVGVGLNLQEFEHRFSLVFWINENSFKQAQENLSWEKYEKRLLNIYKEVKL